MSGPRKQRFACVIRTWLATLYDHSESAGEFKISLWSVPPEGQQRIEQWLQLAEETEEYAGIPGVAGATWLDAVYLRAKR